MKRIMLAAFSAAIVALVLVSPASATDANSSGSGTQPVAAVDKDYRIVEEDILRIDVWGEPQLSNLEMQVTPDGKITVPYVGDIQAPDLHRKI